MSRQCPEQLDALRTHATIESTESSNRIEGVVAAAGRVADLVVRNAQLRDRSEQEIAGYRDALRLVHESHADMGSRKASSFSCTRCSTVISLVRAGAGKARTTRSSSATARVRVRQQPEMLGEVPPEPDDAGICEALPHPQIGGKRT
jgi:hypothetical protein